MILGVVILCWKWNLWHYVAYFDENLAPMDYLFLIREVEANEDKHGEILFGDAKAYGETYFSFSHQYMSLNAMCILEYK